MDGERMPLAYSYTEGEVEALWFFDPGFPFFRTFVRMEN